MSGERLSNYGRMWCSRIAYLDRMHSRAMSLVSPRLRLPPMPTIRDLLQIYKINAQKHLSQNFLLEQRLVEKIAKACVKSRNIEDSYIIEVGPGPGGIARALLQNGAAHVTVIEKDRRFLPTLQMLEDASNGRLQIHLGDVLSFDMSNLFPEDLKCDWEEGEVYKDWNDVLLIGDGEKKPIKKWRRLRVNGRIPKIHIVGNLPFNIATPLIIRWLRDISERRNVWCYGRIPMTLTFQKEVAERMVADVSEAQRCRLSVMCQNWCFVDHKFTIPGTAFVPKPKVDVGVVRLVPRPQPFIQLPFSMVEKVVRTIFSSRQKHIKHTAAKLFPPGRGGIYSKIPSREELTEELFLLSEVKPSIRAYGLTIQEFGRLCNTFAEMCKKYPVLNKYEYRSAITILDSCNDEFDEEALEKKWEGFDTAVGAYEKLNDRTNVSTN